MRLPSLFRKRGEKVKDQRNLKKWQDKLRKALNNWDLSRFDELEYLYRGTHEVFENINVTSSPAIRKKANNVVNIIYEFIESQIDPSIPQPAVQSKLQDWTEQAQMIEDSLKNDLLESEIIEINDENERNTPICGHSLLLVDWDSDYKHPLYRGRLVISNLHPKQLVPQPNVWKIQDMEHFFVLKSTSRAYIKRRYGVDLPRDGEEFPEANSLSGTGYSSANEAEKVTEIICWYRDNDGDVGRFVWANDEVLEDLPKYFYRRIRKCTACGTAKGEYDYCEICGNVKFKQSIEQTEVLIEDVQLPNGSIIPAGTEIPYYIPKRYPVVMRKNVPKNFCFGGQSDVEAIADQADALKKVISTVEEKILRGGHIIKAADDHVFSLTNELYQVVRGSMAQLQVFGVENLTADISRDLAFAQEQYKSAQSVLGITDSYQGKPDTTAKSGVAKQVQVQQAAGRLQSKTVNKHSSYKELFETMFEMKLSLCDEKRPYVRQKEDGTQEYGEFNKYAFLAQDASGEWYYNIDFVFTSDAGSGLPKDKMFLLERTEGLLQKNAFETSPGNIRFWTILDQLKFPGAAEIKSQMQEEIEQQQQMQAMQAMQQPAGMGQMVGQIDPNAIIQQLPPEQQQMFMQLPPEQQQMLLNEATGSVE